jgi:hypothetical protein
MGILYKTSYVYYSTNVLINKRVKEYLQYFKISNNRAIKVAAAEIITVKS